ncbi:MAG: hypothetical protein ACYS5V_05660 [Planctomycetota bacterium]|jgi:hypothetical protein
MRKLTALLVALIVPAGMAMAETVRLRATADVWLSDANNEERNSSSGLAGRLKIKSIQEMAAIRFDASPAAGRKVLAARLFLRPTGEHMLRYIRVSTVNGDWIEGTGRTGYGPGDGATFNHADFATRRPWAWRGSQFCDVIMGSGNTLTCWAEAQKAPGGWLSVKVSPELVYALVAADTDGLAVMDGGTLAFFNNFVHSVQSGASAPYVSVELGDALTRVPAKPRLRAAPAPRLAHLATGAVTVTIDPDPNVLCWRVKVNGRGVERWRIKHPAASGPTRLVLDELPPKTACRLEVVAVAPGGAASAPAVATVTSSPSLDQRVRLGAFVPPEGGSAPPSRRGKVRVWALPPLVKINPARPRALFDDLGAGGDPTRANAVWDGKRIRLHGCRGEYVSYQLCIENLGKAPLKGVKIVPQPLTGTGSTRIGGSEVELYKNWYARNKNNKWQPAYCVPLAHGQAFQIPDPRRKLRVQQNQTVVVDVYVPKDAKPGKATGSVTVSAAGAEDIALPVELTVYDFVLPDRLSFWPELNAYNVPRNTHDYYRLAHQHRCIMNCWVIRPQLRGSGRNIKVDWTRYDKVVGPLVSGKAFRNNRRASMPVECMYLPFEDSWPTPLTRQTYNYQGHWPGRGESNDHITKHYMTAPYIGDALSQDYKDAFAAVQKQFVKHFRRKGWNRTEMQCFYGGKNTHRTQYGVNMWWTTDEPYHWDDWLSLQFFDRLWTKGRKALGVGADRWAARADISRPQWQGKVLDGIVDTVYFGTGAFGSADMYRRCRLLEQDTHLKVMVYGSANPDNASNTQSVVWILNAWTNRANGVLPWQTLCGSERALDTNDSATSGNALLVPAEQRLGMTVVGDMRLKALREGQQIAEYMKILADRHGLTREQIKAMVHAAVRIKAGVAAGAGADNADALRFSTLKAWQIAELRRTLAELIVSKGG